MSKKIKNGIFIILLSIVILGNYNIVSAEDDENGPTFKCIPTCAVTKDPDTGEYKATWEGSDGSLWIQANPEKCLEINGNKECSENTNGNTQCCQEMNEEEYKRINGDYDAKDLLTKIISISNQLLGVVGSIALLFFIVAGIQMIFSGGSEEKISSARTMMVQTVIGLVIFLSAYLIVSFIQDTLIIHSTEDGDKNFKLDSNQF